jgi:hypothetical protein
MPMAIRWSIDGFHTWTLEASGEQKADLVVLNDMRSRRHSTCIGAAAHYVARML